jgi:tetratricopeptide (TPR) repeat protein
VEIIRLPIIALLVALSTLALSAGETVFSLQSIDASLAKIAEHAQTVPPQFSSDEERTQTEADLRALLKTLDAAVVKYSDDPEIIFRDGFANALGNNLGFEGCAAKYFKAFDQLLARNPNDKRAYYYYGVFLSATPARQKDGIKYLEKAVTLGVADAHYTLAFLYLGQGNKPQALAHLREYARQHPQDINLQLQISAIEQAKLPLPNQKPPAKKN